MDAVSQLTSSLSVSGMAVDIALVGGLILILFLFGSYVGKGPFIGLLVSLYAGYSLYVTFPFTSYLPSSSPWALLGASIGLYLLLSAIAYLVLRRAVVSDFIYISFVGMIILSVLGTGLILALAFHIFPVTPVHTFSPLLALLFAPPEYFFWWFLAPLVGLFVLAK